MHVQQSLVTNCPRGGSSPIYVSGEKDIKSEVRDGSICNQFFKIKFAVLQEENYVPTNT